MKSFSQTTLSLRDKILATPRRGKRKIIAISGAPGSGKSTLADCLAKLLVDSGCETKVVPMDGFHLDNSVLTKRKLMHRKGAPETFDVDGLLSLVSRLSDEDGVRFPVFDRAQDASLPEAGTISESCDTIIIEGNYLLVAMPVWSDLRKYWDLSIALRIAEETLRERLIQRWLDYGLSETDAIARAELNDLRNAKLVFAHTNSADIWI